jgi:hypothetical protein
MTLVFSADVTTPKWHLVPLGNGLAYVAIWYMQAALPDDMGLQSCLLFQCEWDEVQLVAPHRQYGSDGWQYKPAHLQLAQHVLNTLQHQDHPITLN